MPVGRLNDAKIIRVGFIEEKIRSDFRELQSGRFEERKLAAAIHRKMAILKENPSSGIQIARKLWPKRYVVRYAIDNLWKLNLPEGWRLIYTIRRTNVEIVSLILEWFPHREYERRFKY